MYRPTQLRSFFFYHLPELHKIFILCNYCLHKKTEPSYRLYPTLKEPLLSPFLFNRHNPDAFGRFNTPKIMVKPTGKVCVE